MSSSWHRLLLFTPALVGCALGAPRYAASAAPVVSVASVAPVAPGPGAGVYEVQVLDEREAPIAGLALVMTTPTRTSTVTTGADGWARVQDAPGDGWVRVASVEQFAELTRGWEARPRRTAKVPTGEEWVVRTPKAFGEKVRVTSGKKRLLLVLTRTDLAHHSAYISCSHPHLAAPGPFRLVIEPNRIELSIHSNGLGRVAVVTCAEARGEVEWFRVDVDQLHHDLQAGDMESVFAVLEKMREP